jgi:hypothetical protein
MCSKRNGYARHDKTRSPDDLAPVFVHVQHVQDTFRARVGVAGTLDTLFQTFSSISVSHTVFFVETKTLLRGNNQCAYDTLKILIWRIKHTGNTVLTKNIIR